MTGLKSSMMSPLCPPVQGAEQSRPHTLAATCRGTRSCVNRVISRGYPSRLLLAVGIGGARGYRTCIWKVLILLDVPGCELRLPGFSRTLRRRFLVARRASRDAEIWCAPTPGLSKVRADSGDNECCRTNRDFLQAHEKLPLVVVVALPEPRLHPYTDTCPFRLTLVSAIWQRIYVQVIPNRL